MIPLPDRQKVWRCLFV